MPTDFHEIARKQGVARPTLDLFEACQEGDPIMAKAALASGADPHAIITSFGYTPLLLAARMGSFECLELLIPLSNARLGDSYNQTALILAATAGASDAEHCVELLLPVSDLAAVDTYFYSTAEEMAREIGYDRIADLIQNYPARQAALLEAKALRQSTDEPARARAMGSETRPPKPRSL